MIINQKNRRKLGTGWIFLLRGGCIFAGLAAQVPVMIDIGKISDRHEPKSDTINLVKNWMI